MSKFKKGQSGNPAGRPKGSKNKSTIFKERVFEIINQRDDELKEVDIGQLARIASKFVPKDIVIDTQKQLGFNIFLEGMVERAEQAEEDRRKVLGE